MAPSICTISQTAPIPTAIADQGDWSTKIASRRARTKIKMVSGVFSTSAIPNGTSMAKSIQQVEQVTIRFAGDSGDGMQLTGSRFTSETAAFGNDLSTLPNFPAEIRAPAGTLPGVSSFQLHFASHDILTPGDRPDVLVVMNPAALKTNLCDLPAGGMVIVNTDEFTKRNLTKVGYGSDPLEDG